MMDLALAAVVALVVYAVRVAAHGTAITPDGAYYLAVRSGRVPRPYCLRPLARLLPTVAAWRAVHVVAWLAASMAAGVVAQRAGVSAVLVVATLVSLPWMRTAVAWPVLLDVPLLAAAALCAAAAPFVSPAVLAVLVAACAIVHERAPLWAALYAAPYTADPVPAFVVVGAMAAVYAIAHRMAAPHPDEQRIAWLRAPLRAAWHKHRATLHDARVWLLPLGGAVVGFAALDAHLLACAIVAYGGCAVAQDRARIYGMLALPLCLAAVDVAGPYAILLPLVTWFINTREV